IEEGRALDQEAPRVVVGVQQGLDVLLQRRVAGTGGGQVGRPIGPWLSKSVVEEFFCVHGLPLSTQARNRVENHHAIQKKGGRPVSTGADGRLQPGSGIGPVPVRGGRRNGQHVGSLIVG